MEGLAKMPGLPVCPKAKSDRLLGLVHMARMDIPGFKLMTFQSRPLQTKIPCQNSLSGMPVWNSGLEFRFATACLEYRSIGS
ncbi:hypothetical protein Nepgr_009788 [Nepenthes gracilis]|uniref:Uncharacterized protein n=1 Tax=Nepenthes gracilis TaxID=150966 RepID=A0AAD3XKG7_NEPGR|nr:hypothetical protein Nepgr_009788 [Nepenthes gracilis]